MIFRSCRVRFIYSFPCYCGLYPCARQHRDIDYELIIISKTGQSKDDSEENSHVVRINVEWSWGPSYLVGPVSGERAHQLY